jgi:hypothetical protein
MACSMPALQCRDGRRVSMANPKEQQLQAFARRAARVSRALWPTNVRRAIATNRLAQTRRRLIVSLRHHSRGGARVVEWGSPLRAPSGLKTIEEREAASFSPIQLKERRPQGSSPFLLSTSVSTMNITGVSMIVLTGGSIVILVVTRLWLPFILLMIALVVTVLLLALVRGRVVSMRRLQQGSESRSFPGILSRSQSPNTPMPLEPPLVRVLETYDLSQTDVEHFLDLPEGGNTGGYSLTNLKEAQGKLPRTVRE